MISRKLQSCYVATATPFMPWRNSQPEINYESLSRLIEHILAGGIKGIVVPGSTGSASALSQSQHIELIKKVKEIVGDRAEVIAADGANTPWEALELAKRVEQEAGINTHLSASSYYVNASDAGIQRHFEYLADNLEGRLILYSIPSRTNRAITPQITARLAKHPKIIGLKDCSKTFEETKEKIDLTRQDDFSVLSGDDSKALAIIQAGGKGLISTAGNLVPGKIRELVDLALSGDTERSKLLDVSLVELYSALFPQPRTGITYASPNPVMLHHALNRAGFNVGDSAVQLHSGYEWEKRAVDHALKSLGILA